MNKITTKYGIFSYPNTVKGVAEYVLEVKTWEKESKCRIYFKAINPTNNKRIDCGWYDVEKGTSALSSNPVAIARMIEREINFEKFTK